MKHHLTQGLHICIVTNLSGGFGGSMFALELFVVCKKHGIPAILVTFDYHRPYPDIGPDLRRLVAPRSGSSDRRRYILLDELKQVFDEARANHKFVVIDVPVGFAMNQAVLELLRDGGIAEASTISALVPVMAGDQGTTSAEMALRAFPGSGANFNRGLIRCFVLPGESSRIGLSRLPSYPVWRPSFLSPRAVELFHQEVERAGNPSFDHLPRLREIEADVKTPRSDPGPTREAITHLEYAKKAIYQTILSPIATRMA